MQDFEYPDAMSDLHSNSSTQTVSTATTSPNLSTLKLNNKYQQTPTSTSTTPTRALLDTDNLAITTITGDSGNGSSSSEYIENGNRNENSENTTMEEGSTTSGSVINEQSAGTVSGQTLVTPATPTPSTSAGQFYNNSTYNITAGNGNTHDIDEIDGDVKLILKIIESTYQSILSGNNHQQASNQDVITSQFKDIQTALLRLNLHKNLARHQMKAYEEEFQTERQILLRSLQNFEKNLTIIKNENEMINIKNLKLIKYCKTLKNDKIDKFRKENHLLKKRLYENGIPYSDISPNKSRTHSSSSSQTQIHHTSNISTPNTPYDQKEITIGSPQTGSSSNANLLDTLGRLASHVLQDEQLNGSFQKKSS